MNPKWTKTAFPVHLHNTSIFDFTVLGERERRRAELQWNQFDFQRAIRDDAYPGYYFIEYLMQIAKTDPGSREPICELFRSYIGKMEEFMREPEKESS